MRVASPYTAWNAHRASAARHSRGSGGAAARTVRRLAAVWPGQVSCCSAKLVACTILAGCRGWRHSKHGDAIVCYATTAASGNKALRFPREVCDPQRGGGPECGVAAGRREPKQRGTCYVYHNPQGNQLYLCGDAGTAWLTSALTAGGSGRSGRSAHDLWRSSRFGYSGFSLCPTDLTCIVCSSRLPEIWGGSAKPATKRSPRSTRPLQCPPRSFSSRLACRCSRKTENVTYPHFHLSSAPANRRMFAISAFL
jgi:hypothetical protein